MALKKISLFFLVTILYNFSMLYADAVPIASAQPVTSDILMSGKVPLENLSSFKNLNDTVASYPIRGIFPDGTIQQGILNRTIKTMPPVKTQPILSKGNFSVLRAKKGDFASYPGGASLFTRYSDLSSKFDAMIEMFQKNPHFIPFFRKVHINVLNQLYHYLMSIYVNFNLQHIGITQNNDGLLQVDIPMFVQYEKEYAANKKTLIINHLVNVIESQFNSAIRSYVPKIPQVYASYIGKTLVQNDYSIDLTRFLDQEISSDEIKNKQQYLQGMVVYLDFFQAYTKYLQIVHPEEPQFTAFVDIAEKINQFLYGDIDKNADQSLTAISKMNPPLFSFNYDDIRALKIIPHLAQTLPKNSSKIMWPEHIVQAANEGIVLHMPGQDPHPIAYFRTGLGTVVKNTNNDPTVKLYICMRTGKNLFEEELIAQPEWLNSWDGVVKIMQACFGDFSALVGLGILDPCMETFIELVLGVQQGKNITDANTNSLMCTNLIKIWKQNQNPASQPTSIEPSSLPNLSGINLPTLPSLPSSLPNDSPQNFSSSLLQSAAG